MHPCNVITTFHFLIKFPEEERLYRPKYRKPQAPLPLLFLLFSPFVLVKTAWFGYRHNCESFEGKNAGKQIRNRFGFTYGNKTRDFLEMFEWKTKSDVNSAHFTELRFAYLERVLE